MSVSVPKIGTFHALVLSAITDGVVVPCSASLCPQHQLTVEMWIFADACKRNPTFLTLTNEAWDCGYGLVGKREGEALLFHSDLLDDPSLERVVGAIEPAKWTHLCGTFDGHEIRVFVNGTMKANTKVPTKTAIAHAAPTCSLRIGHTPWGRSKFGFVGMIAELRVWAISKGDAEVVRLMQGLPLDSKSRIGLVLHMTFDPGLPDAVQGDGAHVEDLSGLGNHGKLVGGAKLARLSPPPIPPFAPSFSLRALCLAETAKVQAKAKAAAAREREKFSLTSPEGPARATAAAHPPSSAPSATSVARTATTSAGFVGGALQAASKQGTKYLGVNVQELLRLSIPALTFRLTGPAALDTPLTEKFSITNPSASRITVQFPKDLTTHRYVLKFDPSALTIKPGAMMDVKATITLLCTTMVHEDVEIALFADASKKSTTFFKSKKPEDTGPLAPDAVQLLRIDLESVLSTRLDYTELQKDEKPIGEGSFGVVYTGQWRGMQVAIKQLKMQILSKVELQDFVKEIRMMERLRSPYVVNFIGAVLTEGHLALVTEFMPLGNSLLKHKKIKSISVKIRIAQDAARGLDFLHQNNIIHRDVKNENLLVSSLSKRSAVMVKLADFGTSRNEANSLKIEMTGGVGTPAFMSPEILERQPYGKPADIYSFAMLMYELWTEKCPYSTSEFVNPWDIAKFVVSGKRLPVPKDMPPVFANVMQLCWNPEPAKRPTFAAVIQMLQEAISAK